MTTQRTITLLADQWDVILEAVECHCDEGPPGEGWKSSKLSAASAALSSALAEPELEEPADEELLAVAIESQIVASDGTNPWREDADIEDEVVQFARPVLARRGHPSIEWKELTDEEIGEWFNRWWRNEGSAMRPLPGHDCEEHGRRISEIAWANGAYVARWGSLTQHGCTQLP
jgi:hypothetical protein